MLLALSNKFYDSFDSNVAKKNAQNLLEDLIRLFLSACSHAFTKDIKDLIRLFLSACSHAFTKDIRNSNKKKK